ncbi:hypothetical protein Pint_06701 [Pistacia integerrima]|uniref:Uncharacterized protein n=1 Tax=Pistacia integerrima TaxID=434235 RepID=A0ACC0Z9F2_9ROSI|nr:hypothetical protein Pint_06701 [Pistacia integerrima]
MATLLKLDGVGWREKELALSAGLWLKLQTYDHSGMDQQACCSSYSN